MSYLYIHIGLPKTATTFIQHSIFAKLSEINYSNRKKTDDFFRSYSGGFGSRILFSMSPAVWTGVAGQAMEEFLRKNGPDKPLVMSDENFSVNAKYFNFAKSVLYTDPALTAFHLRAIDKISRRCGFDGLKVVFSFRRQDTWLASRYAQSAPGIPNASQEDFERRVSKLLDEQSEFYRRSAWLNYAYVFEVLSEALGVDSVLVLSMEGLSQDPSGFINNLDDFLETEGAITRLADREGFFAKKSTNLVSENEWSLLDENGYKSVRTIFLSNELSERVMSRFGQHNKVFSAMISENLSQYSYF